MSYLFIKNLFLKEKLVLLKKGKLKKTKKPKKYIFSGFFSVFFFGFFWLGFLCGFFIANPAVRYSYRLVTVFFTDPTVYPQLLQQHGGQGSADRNHLPGRWPQHAAWGLQASFFTVILSCDLIFLYILIFIYARIGMFSFFLLLTSTTNVRNLELEHFL